MDETVSSRMGKVKPTPRETHKASALLGQPRGDGNVSLGAAQGLARGTLVTERRGESSARNHKVALDKEG